jgi:3-hydroxy-9,10-secoandrosta-1,3,5(10)-triene-9,17-dione monooxygenase reductase component
VPLLRGCAARFQCRTAFQYDGGDHVIFVGEVIGFDRSPSPPLVFHDGRYALTLPKNATASSGLTGSFSKDFLGYLMGRGHIMIRRQLKGRAKPADVGNDEHFILSALAVHERLTPRELEATVGDLLAGPLRDALMVLEAQGHVRCEGSGADRVCELAGSGRERALRTMAAAKSFEAQVVEQFGAEDTFILKSLLRRLLDVMGPARDKTEV